MILTKGTEGQDCAPAKQTKVSDLGFKTLISHTRHEIVKRIRRASLKKGLTLPRNALRRNDVVSLLEECHHPRQKLRRVLKVRIHNDHCIAIGKIEPGRNGSLVAEVATETD